ncbi:hypothetical protein EC2741950_3735 [Escherichia coli 2741950]|nr:hypothetical protein EC2741950_3735 [Escherichia coli 2741950]
MSAARAAMSASNMSTMSSATPRCSLFMVIIPGLRLSWRLFSR